MRRRLVALLIGVLVLAPAAVSADTLEPAQWPEEVALGSAPNALRFGGIDRYWTSSATALALRGDGEFPFDTPDPAVGGGPTLASASGWWGAGTCPRSVILVAGDTPADAIAAASLSDPTNRSDEPRLERVAAADPLFDPIGGFDRIDTASAPIVVTRSARDGAASLGASARLTASDLRSGACTAAREAIIVGGDAAVPAAVETELVSLGYEEVFRVAGVDRFDTAARIAAALGTEPVPEGLDCVDERVDDGATAMSFYANSVIEYRPDSVTCDLHGRTVVLADGIVGADALAAGWWTSYWQVPVLLVDGDGSLPPATRTALQTIPIDTIVVLGGTGRIPEPVVQEASRLAGDAAVGRFGGRDRYETSVITAAVFGGWHPTGDATDVDADRVCLAASTGVQAGWPDALGAGPLCGRLTAAAADVRAPSRVPAPVEQATGVVVPPRSSHDAVPVLLVPAGAAMPTPSVAALLSSSFRSGAPWCRGGSTGPCLSPGFAVAFGGSAAVTDGALASMSALLEGSDPAVPVPAPAAIAPFVTELDLRPVFTRLAPDEQRVACVGRDAVAASRWLATYVDESLAALVDAVDLVSSRVYDAGVAGPVCVGVGPGGPGAVVAPVTADGRHGAPLAAGSKASQRLSMSGPMRHDGPLSSGGADGTSTVPGDTTTWRFRDSPSAPLSVTDPGSVWAVASASATITLTRETGTRARFNGVVRLEDGSTGIEGPVQGAALLVGDRWELAGRSEMGEVMGGFRGSVLTNGTADRGDDVLIWRLDGADAP